MRANEFITESKKKPGTFAGVRFSPKTKKALSKYITDNNIPNPVIASEFHATLLYSKKHCPDYEAAGKIDPMYKGKPGKFAIWGDDDESVLVLKFDCPELAARHKELMKEHDATFDYPSFKPHLTLSYNAEGIKIKDLPAFTATIEIVSEYSSDIEENWAEDL